MWRRGGGDFRFRSEDSDCFWRSVVAAKYRKTWGEWTFEMVEANIGVIFGRELKLVWKSSLL